MALVLPSERWASRPESKRVIAELLLLERRLDIMNISIKKTIRFESFFATLQLLVEGISIFSTGVQSPGGGARGGGGVLSCDPSYLISDIFFVNALLRISRSEKLI